MSSQNNELENLPKYKHLVFSGGGIRGVSYLGAIKAFELHDCLSEVETYIGSSIGALFASLLYIGYTSDEMKDIIFSTDLNSLRSREPLKLHTSFGIDSGKNLVNYIKNIIKKKVDNEDITFGQLRELIKDKKLTITGTCLNTFSTLYFNYEQTPNTRLVDAIRMSISVPIVFTAVKYKGLVHTDGGYLDNFPLHLVKDEEHVLGFNFKNSVHDENPHYEINGLETYLMALIDCALTEIEKLKIKECSHLSSNIVTIDVSDVNSLDFFISFDKKSKLYDAGLKAGIKFISERIE